MKALRVFLRSFWGSLIIERDSLFHMIFWVSHIGSEPWNLKFCFGEIKALASLHVVSFSHVWIG